MKTTKLISGVVSILIVLGFTLSYAEEEKAYVATETEEYYGTWVNPEYKPKAFGGFPVKRVYNSDGTWEIYYLEEMTTPTWRGFYTIIDKWTDSEGSVWYKVASETRGGAYKDKHLVKISNSGNTYESAESYDYPAEIDPTHPNYRIYYRK
jgi:hypothetical protein